MHMEEYIFCIRKRLLYFEIIDGMNTMPYPQKDSYTYLVFMVFMGRQGSIISEDEKNKVFFGLTLLQFWNFGIIPLLFAYLEAYH